MQEEQTKKGNLGKPQSKQAVKNQIESYMSNAKKDHSSQYLGVSFNNKTNKYTAQIGVKYKVIYLGSFDTEIKAAKVRDKATKKYLGKFGYYNFPISATVKTALTPLSIVKDAVNVVTGEAFDDLADGEL